MKRFVITFLLMLAVFTIVFSFRADIEKQLELERVFRQLEQEYEQAVAKGDKIAANRAAAIYTIISSPIQQEICRRESSTD